MIDGIRIEDSPAHVDGTNSVLFVAHAGFGIIGRCELLILARSASVRMLHVVEVHRRKGIATELMRRAESCAVACGRKTMGLSVRPDNLEAIPLYEKLGYVVTWEDEDGTLAMCKRLDETDETESDLDAESREIWASLSPAERERAIRMATQESRGT